MNEVAAFQAHPRPSRWESISAVDGRQSNKWSSRDDSNWDIQKWWKATRQLFYRLHFRVFAFHHRRRHLASRFLHELRLNMVEQNHCIAVARGNPASLRYVEKANKNSKAPDSVSNQVESLKIQALSHDCFNIRGCRHLFHTGPASQKANSDSQRAAVRR